MPAHAETARPIKIIVGLPPGGGADAYARLVQRHLGRSHSRRARDRGAEHAGRGLVAVGDGARQRADDGTVIGAFSSALITEAITAPERVKVDFRGLAWIGNVSEDVRVCYVRGAHRGAHLAATCWPATRSSSARPPPATPETSTPPCCAICSA